MAYKVEFDPQAIDDLQGMRAFERSAIIDKVSRILTTNPTQLSKSRIKRLRGLDTPQFRLRVDECRIFYDVIGGEVYILRILTKEDVDEYLKEMGYEG